MKAIAYGMLLAIWLSVAGCTVGEALLGAGAAGLGGYLLGEHSGDHRPTRYYRCEEGKHYDRCY